MAVHGGERLDFIEGLRGVAIAAVLICHVVVGGDPRGLIFRVAHFGSAGVDLFFVISGFCMLWPLLRDGKVGSLSAGRFYARRYLRIAPPYLVAIAAALAVSALIWQFGGPSWWPAPMQYVFPTSVGDLAGNLAAHVTFTHGFFRAYDGSIDGVFWSLATEWQFYFVLPLLVLIIRRVGVLAGVALTVGVSVAYTLVAHAVDQTILQNAVGGTNILVRFVEFGAGMLVAWLVSIRRPVPFITVWTAFWLVAAVWIDRHGPAVGLPFAWAAAFGGLALAGWQQRTVRRMLTLRPIRWLGRISYSTYLIHRTVFMAIAITVGRGDLGYGTRLAVMMVVGVPAALAVATVMHRLIERPAVRWSHAIRGARRVPTARSAPT